MPAPTFRHHAFICHCAADNSAEGRRWADWAQQALESFDVPADIAGRPTPGGPVPARLFPIARSGDAGAIEQSRMLIVVCSPAAAESPAVAEEIRIFKMSGRDRLFALLVEGAGDACFPETLLHDVRPDGSLDREWLTRPPAADLRAGGFASAAALQDSLESSGIPRGAIRERVAAHARQLDEAREKLIAAVLGIPPSELGRRGPAREIAIARAGRRRAWIAAALFALLAGAAGWLAWREHDARAGLADARDRADTLIGELGRDLRGTLEPAGQLALLAGFNERVTSHLATATRERDEPRLLGFLATVYADATDIARARARLPEAHEAALQSLQLRERIAALPAPPSGAALDLSAARRRLSRTLAQLGKKTEALGEANAARALTAKLRQAHPDSEEVLREDAVAHREAGELLADIGKLDEALAVLTTACDSARRLAERASAEQAALAALAQCHARLGEIHQRRADYAAARDEFAAAVKLRVVLASTEPLDSFAQPALATAHSQLGAALVLGRKFTEAAASHRAAVEITTRLAKSAVVGDDLLFDHAMNLRRLGEVLLQGEPESRTEAATTFQRALDHIAARMPGDFRATQMRAEIESLLKAATR